MLLAQPPGKLVVSLPSVVSEVGLEAPHISRRPMQVHCGEMQVLDLGQGGRHVPAQGLGLWLPEQGWNSLWGGLLSQGARVGYVLSSSDSSLLTMYRAQNYAL